jgi:hypothetical protein
MLSAVLLLMAVRLVIVTESAERRIVALCLSLMMTALLLQGIIGNDNTALIATAVFFSSLVVLAYFLVRRATPGQSDV